MLLFMLSIHCQNQDIQDYQDVQDEDKYCIAI